ncbi:ferritin-like domain-containing protein [Novosphingobium sp.]|uniref:ferritin-like domain-containing protein n=1 Tax=Novosphingobium sp. TaxID=1874826 RepID=UPI001E0FA6B4|nr:ferritin-like domain-containing protein [Novosphingobium sp.]MBX9665907.1 ferritin-like domain-containing protein [Novosphingobium sp.]
MTDLIDTNPQTRRALFRSAGVVAAGIGMAGIATPLLAGAGKTTKKSTTMSSDVSVMQGALALEHEGIAAYRIAGGSGLLSKGVLDVALVFLGHHQGHRDSLAKLIAAAGGKPVEPKTDDEYIKELNIASLKSEGDVIKFAAGLEQGATNAYVGQLAAIKDHQLAHLFGQLGTDEAVHWAILNNAAGGTIQKAAYLFG